MSESEDSDILADIQALDDALLLNNKADGSWHDLHDNSSSSMDDESDNSCSDDESYIQSCDNVESMNAYEINKKLLKGLMAVKRKLNTMLQQCNEKIEELNEDIETTKNEGALNERARYSIAGMPYFKDKFGFGAPRNCDTKIKEARGELSVIYVQKSSRWSSKDRTTLLNAVCEEVFKSISDFNVETESDGGTRALRNQTEVFGTINTEPGKSSNATHSSDKEAIVIPMNFNEMVKAMGGKEFDWMKIAAQDFENKHSSCECRSMWNVYLHPDIKKGDWTTKEDKGLLKYVKEYNYQDWDSIAAKLDTKRSGYQCFIRFNTIHSLPVAGRNWTKLEDEHLQLVINKLQIGNYIPWSEVAIYLDNRTKQQVYTRWMYRKAPHLTKGRFASHETQTLLKAVKQYGTDFGKIARYVMPHRTTIQLNGHYNTLLLQVKENLWRYEDDIKLMKLHKKYGNNWVEIAKGFAFKTRIQVRHRYSALQKYINKGYKITTIPRSDQATSLDKSTLSSSSSSSKNSEPRIRVRCDISNNDIQARLFENLSFPLVMASTNSQECYGAKQFARNTKELYDMLQRLDVKLDVPNNLVDYAHLNKKERQLFISLNKYVSAHHMSNEKRDEIIEVFRCRMFGSKPEVTSHFIPPLPFGGYIKNMRKSTCKRSKTNSINYNIDYREKFLVDLSEDMVAFFDINSFFVSVEEEIQFHKLGQLLSNNNYNYNKQNVNTHAPSCKPLNETIRAPLRFKSNTEIKMEKSETEVVQKTQSTTRSKCITERNEMDTSDDAIIPSHETLLGLKNLLYWKMLYEYESAKFFSNDSTKQSKKSNSHEYEKAYQTLKTRLIRLFKLPLALSRIMLNLPEQKMLFLTEEPREDITKKSSEKRTEKKNK